MKSLLLVLSFFLSTSAISTSATAADIIKSECYVQAKTYKDLTSSIDKNSTFWGILAYSLVGELDQEVLGEGGFFALATAFSVYLIYENNEMAPLSSALEENLKKGYEYLALNPQCLKRVESPTMQNVMRDLAHNPVSRLEYYQVK